MPYIYSEEIEERDIPKATKEDWDHNFEESYNREEAALTAAANAVAIVWPVASEEAMLDLGDAKVGHEAKRTDLKQVFTLTQMPPSTLENWVLTAIYQVVVENITGLTEALDAKVAVTDIVDDLVSTDDDKPLSANMGRALNENKRNVLAPAEGWGTFVGEDISGFNSDDFNSETGTKDVEDLAKVVSSIVNLLKTRGEIGPL